MARGADLCSKEKGKLISLLPLIVWCRHQESNSGPADYKAAALPRLSYSGFVSILDQIEARILQKITWWFNSAKRHLFSRLRWCGGWGMIVQSNSKMRQKLLTREILQSLTHLSQQFPMRCRQKLKYQDFFARKNIERRNSQDSSNSSQQPNSSVACLASLMLKMIFCRNRRAWTTEMKNTKLNRILLKYSQA